MKISKKDKSRVKGVHRSLNCPRWGRASALLALGILLLFSTSIWARSKGLYRGKSPAQHQRYREAAFPHLWKTPDGQVAQKILITRKRRKAHPPQDREILGERLRNYESLTPEEKVRLKKKYQRWRSLPPEKRGVLRQRMEKWMELPPEERRLYEQWFHQWQKLSSEERDWIRKKLDSWNSLSPKEKEQIRLKLRKR